MRFTHLPLKIRAGSYWLLGVFLPLFILSCSANRSYEDTEFSDPPAIEFRKTASFNGVPVVELKFEQKFTRDELGNLSSSSLEMGTRNLTNVSIPANSLRYEVIVYDSTLQNAENIRLKPSVTLPDELGSRDSTSDPTSFVQNFFDAVLDHEKVETRLLDYPGGVDYSGAYEGYYLGYRMVELPVDSPYYLSRVILQQRPVQASVDADGLFTAWIEGDNAIKKLSGSISPRDTFFLGDASHQDSSSTIALSRCDSCAVEIGNGDFNLEIGVNDSSKTGGVQVIELLLSPTTQKN